MPNPYLKMPKKRILFVYFALWVQLSWCKNIEFKGSGWSSTHINIQSIAQMNQKITSQSYMYKPVHYDTNHWLRTASVSPPTSVQRGQFSYRASKVNYGRCWEKHKEREQQPNPFLVSQDLGQCWGKDKGPALSEPQCRRPCCLPLFCSSKCVLFLPAIQQPHPCWWYWSPPCWHMTLQGSHSASAGVRMPVLEAGRKQHTSSV